MAHKYNIWWVYSTFPTKQEAVFVAEQLLMERYAACVNILPQMTSLFRWEDTIKHEQEYLLLAKTQKSLVSGAVDRVKDLHSYDLPCIMALPLPEGHLPFMQWVESEVKLSD